MLKIHRACNSSGRPALTSEGQGLSATLPGDTTPEAGVECGPRLPTACRDRYCLSLLVQSRGPEAASPLLSAQPGSICRTSQEVGSTGSWAPTDRFTPYGQVREVAVLSPSNRGSKMGLPSTTGNSRDLALRTRAWVGVEGFLRRWQPTAGEAPGAKRLWW